MNLTTIIEQYISQKDTDFSILINGSWGSGKTYFLKNEVKPRIEQCECVFKNGAKYEMVYVSLYGLRSSDELQKKLFLEINPKLKTKASKIGGFILGKALDAFGAGVDDADETELLSIFGGVPINKVLVFDDLERLETSTLNEVLGFINAYTEHQHLKVLIIADEEKIKEKISDYRNVKEKLVRFTYLYNPRMEDVFDSFSARYSQECQLVIDKNKQFICSLFEAADHKNLRTLRFTLDLFAQLFSESDESLKSVGKYKEQILGRFLFFLLAYSIVYKKGASEDELESLKSFSVDLLTPQVDRFVIKQLVSELPKGNVEEEKPLEGLEKFRSEFEGIFLNSDSNAFEYFDFLAYFIHSGDLRLDELKGEIVKLCKMFTEIEEKPELIALNRLNNCLYLDDEDLLPLIDEIISYVEKGLYKLEVYSGIFQTILNSQLNGIQGVSVNSDTVEIFKTGIDRSIEHSEYHPDLRHWIYMHQFDHPLLNQLRDHTIERNESIKKIEVNKLSQNFITYFEEGKIENVVELLQSEEVRTTPIFESQSIKPSWFFEHFLKLSNAERMRVVRAFSYSSVRFVYHGPDMLSELGFHQELLEITKQAIADSNTNRKLSTVILEHLSGFLEQTIGRLELIGSNNFY